MLTFQQLCCGRVVLHFLLDGVVFFVSELSEDTNAGSYECFDNLKVC